MHTPNLIFSPTNQSIKLLFIFIVAVLAACSKGEETKKSSQSIVRVNDAEITIHQVNNELQRANVNPKQKELAEKQIVKNLVDREILVQQSIKESLDRNPMVMSAIENSRLQILAQAYLENKVSKIPKPTESEILDYRAKNPDIFENRKLYAMEELAFSIDPTLLKELEALSNTAKTLEEVTAWLDSHQIKFGRTKAVHAAETLPMVLLSKISKMASGEVIFINGPNKVVVAKLLETKSQPISLNDSKPLIERVLMNQKQKKAAEDEMNSLRKSAKIEYLDKKYELKESDMAAKATPAQDLPSTESEIPKNEVPAKAQEKLKESMEKGLSGM